MKSAALAEAQRSRGSSTVSTLCWAPCHRHSPALPTSLTRSPGGERSCDISCTRLHGTWAGPGSFEIAQMCPAGGHSIPTGCPACTLIPSPPSLHLPWHCAQPRCCPPCSQFLPLQFPKIEKKLGSVLLWLICDAEFNYMFPCSFFPASFSVDVMALL